MERNPKGVKPMQSGREWKPTPHMQASGLRWDLNRGPTEVKVRERIHWANLFPFTFVHRTLLGVCQEAASRSRSSWQTQPPPPHSILLSGDLGSKKLRETLFKKTRFLNLPIYTDVCLLPLYTQNFSRVLCKKITGILPRAYYTSNMPVIFFNRAGESTEFKVLTHIGVCDENQNEYSLSDKPTSGITKLYSETPKPVFCIKNLYFLFKHA